MRRYCTGFIVTALLLGNGVTASVPSDFAPENPNLVLEFADAAQQVQELPDGTKQLTVDGAMTNSSSAKQTVPTILLLIRDSEERIVFRHEIAVRTAEVQPGEVLHVHEVVGPFASAGTMLDIGWKPVTGQTGKPQ